MRFLEELKLGAEYCEKYAEIMIEKANGNDEQAFKLWENLCETFGRYEFEIERYFDHWRAMATIKIAVE